MHLGREHEGGKALALLLVDDPVRKDVIEQFRQIPNILSAKVVQCMSQLRKLLKSRNDPFLDAS